MTPRPAGVVPAAGAGTRLRPLTSLRPKALCPVGGVPLVDLALAAHLDGRDALVTNADAYLPGGIGRFAGSRDGPAGHQMPSSFIQAPPTTIQMTMLTALTRAPSRHHAPRVT